MAATVSFSGYMAVGKDEANKILQEFISEDGKFLVRPSDSGKALYTVSVIHKQRILKYPVYQDASDQHYHVSSYPSKFPQLEQLVQHYRRNSISNREAVLLKEPINGWPKSKGEYGVFVRPNSGSSAADRKASMSVRNGPLPPIPTLTDPVSNAGHQRDRQPTPNPPVGRGGGPATMEPPASMPGQRPGGISDRRESRQESQQDLRRDPRKVPRRESFQEARQDPRRDSFQDNRRDSYQEPRQNTQPEPRHSSQPGSVLKSGVGCFIHSDLPHDDVQKVFAPYLARNGSYLIRPSATPGKMTLCVTHNSSIVNFRISRNEKTHMYQITSKKSFESIEELIEAYHSHPIKSKEKKVEIYLVEGIPSGDSSGGSDASLPSPTSPGDQALPAPWAKYFSEEHKKYYFHNTATGATQWESPMPRVKKNRGPLPSLPSEPERPAKQRPRLMSVPSSDRLTTTVKHRPLPTIPDPASDNAAPPVPFRAPHPSPVQSRQDTAPQQNGAPAVSRTNKPPLPAKEEKVAPLRENSAPLLIPSRKAAPPTLPPKEPEESFSPPPLPAAQPSKQKRAPPPLPEKDPPVPRIPDVNGGPPSRPEKSRGDPSNGPRGRGPPVPVCVPPSVPVGGPPRVPVAEPPRVPVAEPPRVPVGGPPSVPVAEPPRVPVGGPPSVPDIRATSVPGGAPPPPPPPPPPPIAPPAPLSSLSLPSSDQLSRSAPSSPAPIGRRNTVTPADLVKGMTTLKRTEKPVLGQKKQLDGMGGILSKKLDEMRSFVQQDSDSEIDEVDSDEEWDE